MGFGIWSMHFVAMLAFQLPMAMSYHLPTVLLSMIVAVAASGLALFVVSRSVMSRNRFLVGGLLMGLAIASVHYVGMAGMRPRADLRYDPAIFALPLLVATAARGTSSPGPSRSRRSPIVSQAYRPGRSPPSQPAQSWSL